MPPIGRGTKQRDHKVTLLGKFSYSLVVVSVNVTAIEPDITADRQAIIVSSLLKVLEDDAAAVSPSCSYTPR